VLAPGEGSIYPAKDGRWGGSVHIGYEDGKRIRKHVMGRTRNEVKDKLGVLMRAHEEKRPIPDQRAKLGPFLRRWLDEVAEPTLRPSTYRSYDAILKHRRALDGQPQRGQAGRRAARAEARDDAAHP
jgi:hypothetical protein